MERTDRSRHRVIHLIRPIGWRETGKSESVRVSECLRRLAGATFQLPGSEETMISISTRQLSDDLSKSKE